MKSVEELSAHPAWKQLSPELQLLLTFCFRDTDFDIVKAVNKCQPSGVSDNIQVDLARKILARSDVRAVIDLYVFGLDSFSLRDTPFAPIDISL
jgi:hypothetical protein